MMAYILRWKFYQKRCIETDTKGDRSAQDNWYFSKENKNQSNSEDFTNKGWINSMCLHFWPVFDIWENMKAGNIIVSLYHVLLKLYFTLLKLLGQSYL